MRHVVSALYHHELEASRAVDALLDAGFDRAAISALMSHETRTSLSRAQRDQLSEGTVVGHTPPGRRSSAGQSIAAGSALGAIIGGIAALASLGIPGGIVVGGPLAALLGGLGAGAVGGGLLGALAGLGIPEAEARIYEDRIQKGDILVSVEAPTHEQAVLADRLLTTSGAHRQPMRWQPAAPTT